MKRYKREERFEQCRELFKRWEAAKAEREAFAAKYKKVLEEYAMGTKSLDLEIQRLREAMDAMLSTTKSLRTHKIQHSTRHWTPVQKKNFERLATRLLTDSPGLAANTICRQLRASYGTGFPILHAMEERGALRRVKVEVQFHNHTKKLKGFALPLKAVGAKRAA